MVSPLKGKNRGRPVSFRGKEYPTRIAFVKELFGGTNASIPTLARMISGRQDNEITEDVFRQLSRSALRRGRSPDSYKGKGSPLSIRRENRRPSHTPFDTSFDTSGGAGAPSGSPQPAPRRPSIPKKRETLRQRETLDHSYPPEVQDEYRGDAMREIGYIERYSE